MIKEMSRDIELDHLISERIEDYNKNRNFIIDFKLNSIEKQISNINQTLKNIGKEFDHLENSNYYRKKQ